MYIDLHWVYGSELRSSGGNASSKPHVPALILRLASNRTGIDNDVEEEEEVEEEGEEEDGD